MNPDYETFELMLYDLIESLTDSELSLDQEHKIDRIKRLVKLNMDSTSVETANNS
jgi:hypothetical protein